MCDVCGCNMNAHGQEQLHAVGAIESLNNDEQTFVYQVQQQLLASNNHQAMHNRHHFENAEVLAVNLMSAPGSGKTALLEAIAEGTNLAPQTTVIEGDLETENDAERVRRQGMDAVQITTGTACHLDAAMVHRALHDIDLAGKRYLFVENVGNLVCPASFDLGQHLNIVMLSVPEGDDKPLKYPVMFRAADLVIISKCDLLEHIPQFVISNVHKALNSLGMQVPVIEFSASTQLGLGSIVDYIQQAWQQRYAIRQSG